MEFKLSTWRRKSDSATGLKGGSPGLAVRRAHALRVPAPTTSVTWYWEQDFMEAGGATRMNNATVQTLGKIGGSNYWWWNRRDGANVVEEVLGAIIGGGADVEGEAWSKRR